MWKTPATNTTPGAPELGLSASILHLIIRTIMAELGAIESSTNQHAKYYIVLMLRYPINIQKTDYLLEKNGKKWYSLAKYTFNQILNKYSLAGYTLDFISVYI